MLSVVIPAWNNAHFLADAVSSALAVADEVIVVDDASTDGSPQQALQSLLDDERVRLLTRETNGGPSGARMLGFEQASGEFLGFLDADDCYAPGALATLKARLVNNPSAEVAMGRKIGVYRQSDGEYAPEGEVVRMYSLGSALMRRTLLNRVALDTTIRHGEDIDWFMRVQEAEAQFELVDDVVQHYRRHDHNLTEVEDGADKHAELADVMARSMFRRRKLAKARGVAVGDIYYVHPDRFGD